MADLYYIEEDYYNPSLGYFVYTADAAAAPSSAFTISCDATVIGAATEANAALTSTATISATATVGKETSVSLTSTATATITATRIQEASAAFTSAFAPSLSVEVFKNSFAVLDCPSVLTVTPSVNRSITQALDTIASLNAMAARTRDLASSLDSTLSLTTSPTALKSSSATLTSTLTLSADALNLQLASASLVTTTTLDTDRYFGSARPRDGFAGTFNYDTSVKKFGTASLTNSSVNFRPFGQNNIYDTTLIPSKTESFILDAWLYFPSGATGTGRYLAFNTSNGVGGIDFLRMDISVTARTIRFRDFGATSNPFDFTSSAQTANTWLYVAIVKSGTTLSAYIDTARVHTVTNSVYTNTSVPWGGYQEQGQGFEILAGSMKVDEVSFNVGTTLGISPSDSTITVPTTARVNDPDTTRFLYHFDSTDLDDITVTALASAALTSTATLSASATKTTGTSSAALTSTTTLSASVTRVLEATAALSTTATQTATATRIPSTAQADLSTTATSACAISVTRDSASALSSSTVQTVDYTRTRQFASAFTSAFSPTLDVTAQRAGFALLESVTTLSAEAAKTTDVAGDLNTLATVTVNAGRLIAISSQLTSASTLSIDYLHLVGVSAAINSEFSTITTASRTRAIASAITATTALTADVSRTRESDSALDFASTLEATGTRIQPGSAALVSTATLDANAVKTATATSAVASVVTQSTLISLTVDPQIATSAIATELVVAFKNATGTITMECSFAQTAIVGKIIQYEPNSLTGIHVYSDSKYPKISLATYPILSYDAENGFIVSIWARRDASSYTGTQVLWSSSVNDIFLSLTGTSVVLTNYVFSSPQTETWPSAIAQDTEWHHILLHWTALNPNLELWVDGENQGLRGNNIGYYTSVFDRGANDYLELGRWHGGANYLHGDLAQIWVGSSKNTGTGFDTFQITDFYADGVQDLGVTGQGVRGNLTPYLYNPLSKPYTGVVFQGGYTQDERPALEYLRTPDLEARALLTAAPSTVIITIAALSAASTITTVIDSRTRSPILVLESQASLSANFIRIRSAQAELISTSTQTTQTDRVTDYQVAMTATATLVCAASELQGISLGVDAQATLTVAYTRTRSILQAIESQVTLSASPDARTRTPILAFAATSTLTCEALTFEGVSCSMSASTSLTVNTQVVKVTPVALTVISTLGAEGFKLVLAQAHLEVTGFQLTQGDIINFLPELEIRVPQETRYRRVLPETRLYSLDSESRTRRVLPESRIITIEQETDVNII